MKMKPSDLYKAFGSVMAFVGFISALPHPQAYRVQPQPVSQHGSRGTVDERAGGSGGSGYGGHKGVHGGGSSAGGYVHSSGGGGGGSQGSASDSVQHTETKYYYGGKYEGDCASDGLYYRDDTAFVICSNGYPHEQPCPPGTKTSGSPKYQAGYYYGYTDLCSVNLVDYGYGPEYYAPKGYPVSDGYGDERKDGGYGGDRRNEPDAYQGGAGRREQGSLGGGHGGGGASVEQSKYPDRNTDYRNKDAFRGKKNADFDRSESLLSNSNKDRFNNFLARSPSQQSEERISYPEVKRILPVVDKALPHHAQGGSGAYSVNAKAQLHNASGGGAFPVNFKDIDALTAGRSSYMSSFEKNKNLERSGFESA